MLYIGPRTWLDLRAKCFCLTRKQTVAPGLTILSALKPHMYMRTKLSAPKPNLCTYVHISKYSIASYYKNDLIFFIEVYMYKWRISTFCGFIVALSNELK